MDVIISALIEANKLLNKKDYYKALDCFECVLNINPTNNLAIIGKTICIHYLKSFDNISLINIIWSFKYVIYLVYLKKN